MAVCGAGKARRWPSWAWPLAVVVLLLAALGWWARPRRVQEWVSFDGTQRWAAEGRPLERHLAWAPPQPVAVESLADVKGGGDGAAALSHPALTADGNVLYIALRRAQGDWDLFSAERGPAGPGMLLPVGPANTAADELAPHVSADGQWLYFSSNRVGGQGGFDLYLCRREGAGWSPPQNLGPAVNSLADELDPALSADGLTLYFSANRAADGQLAQTTDLFRAQRVAMDAPWQPAEPVVEANSPANERTPLVFGEEGSLYFASDRRLRPGELVNFDLYRLRPTAQQRRLEALGPAVNTAANELAPALSPEGTRLLFASDRLGDRRLGAYSLFSSRLVEVELHSVWDTSRLQALAAVWPYAAGLSLLLLLLVVLAARLRGWLFERASLGRYAVLSLLLHGLLLLVLALVPLGTVVVERAREIMAHHGPRSADDNLHQSHRAGSAAYEKLADLRSVERVATADVPRQVLDQPNIPTVSEVHAAALPTTVRQAAAHDLADPRRLLVVQQPPAAAAPGTPDVARQRPPLPVLEVPEDVIVLQRPHSAPESVPAPVLEVARQQAALPLPAEAEWSDAPSLEEPIVPEMVPPPLPTPLGDRLPMPALLPLHQAPRAPAAETIAGEDALPQLAGQPTRESPVPLPQTALPLAEQTPAAPRHELALPTPRVAADRNAGSHSPVELHPGSSQRETTQQVPRAPHNVVSPAGAEPEEVLIVAAKPIPGLADLAPDSATLHWPPNQLAAEPGLQDQPPAMPTAVTRTPESALAATPHVAPHPEPSAPRAPMRAHVVELLAAEEIEQVELPPGQHAQPDSLAFPTPVVEPAAEPAAAITALDATQLDVAGQGTPRRPLIVGSISLSRVDALPSLAPVATRLERLPAEALPVAYAEDNVGLRAMFSLRQGDVRREYIELFGGSAETEAAVNRGLAWLAQHQFEDGHWSLHQLDPPEKSMHATPGAGNAISDTAATGLALLAFLGAGHTHHEGEYRPVVERGLAWLIARQQPDGNLFAERAGNAWMYSHGIAAIALCEAFGLTQDPNLREPAQKALQFIVAAQHPSTGGWRYTPGEAGDTSVVGWQVMALKSGEMAGLEVPSATLDLARRWLASAAGSGGSLGTFGYTGPGGSLAMTAEGLLCHQFLGCRRDDPQLTAGVRILYTNLPQQDRETSYYWYYATQVLYHVQGQEWDAWNRAMRELIVGTQIRDGHLAGTWDPRDQWEQAGGRLYATCLRLLILETYYRHLPLYRPLVQ